MIKQYFFLILYHEGQDEVRRGEINYGKKHIEVIPQGSHQQCRE